MKNNPFIFKILQIFHKSNYKHGINELSYSRGVVYLLFLDVIPHLTRNPARFSEFGFTSAVKCVVSAYVLHSHYECAVAKVGK